MTKFVSWLASLLLASLLALPAYAQTGQLGPGQVWGNSNATQQVAQPSSMPSMFDRAFCSTVGYIVARTSGGWVCSNSIPAPVTWFGAKCDGSTDDTTSLQSAINALSSTTGGPIYVPAVCSFASTLTITRPNVKFVGLGTGYVSVGGGIYAAPSQLLYTGNGARAIDARDTNGLGLDGVAVLYSSATFSGPLVDLGTATTGVSAYARIKNSIFGTTQTARTGTANCLALTSSVDTLVENNYFYHCAPAIIGETVVGKNTVTVLRKNTFAFNEGAQAISSCGEGWVVEGNSFEPTTAGTAGAFQNTSSFPCVGGSWRGNWFGDVTANNGTWVQGYFNGTDFSGNRMAGHGAADGAIGFDFRSSTVDLSGNNIFFTQTAIKLTSSSANISGGNYLQNLNTAVDCSGGSNAGVRLNGNQLPSVTTYVGTPAGCTGLNTDGNSPPISQLGSGQVNVGQSAGNDPLAKTLSGDVSLAASGATSVTNINGVSVASATWTPTDISGAGLTFTSVTGNFQRTNKSCTGNFRLTFPTTANSVAVTLSAPCTTANNGNPAMGTCFSTAASPNAVMVVLGVANTAQFQLVNTAGGATNTKNSDLSTQTLTCSFTLVTT